MAAACVSDSEPQRNDMKLGVCVWGGDCLGQSVPS